MLLLSCVLCAKLFLSLLFAAAAGQDCSVLLMCVCVCVSRLYYVLLTILFAQKVAPPGLDHPSNSTLDRTAHLLFGDDAPSVGTSRSRHSISTSRYYMSAQFSQFHMLIVLDLE
jgi:hypothetical protein